MYVYHSRKILWGGVSEKFETKNEVAYIDKYLLQGDSEDEIVEFL